MRTIFCFADAQSIGRSILRAVILFILAGTATANEIAPPKYNLIDRMGVNMATGQVQVSQTDLSIGGSGGLTHTTFLSTGNLFFRGFRDRYQGSATSQIFNFSGGTITADNFPIVRVTDGVTTSDFTYVQSGSSFIYTALNDPRDTLEFVSGTGLELTQADGTQVIYGTNSFNPTTDFKVDMTHIVYPNGLRLTINKIPNSFAVSSVRSNTGFQLKYQYVDDNRPLDSVKQNSSMEVDEPSDSLAWSRVNPKQLVALNNSIEHCSVAGTFCTLSNSWPTVTYQWPAGMPRAMAVGNSTFSITDPEGRTTSYHHFAFDKAHLLPDNTYYGGILPGTESTPRVISIDFPNGEEFEYQYTNKFRQNAPAGEGFGYPRWFSTGYGLLTNASRGSETAAYTLLVASGPGNDTLNNSIGYQAIKQVEHNNQKGVIRFIDMADKLVEREDSFENKIKYVYSKRTGLYNTFEYDSRLNFTAVKERDTNPQTSANPSFEITLTRAQYPPSCDSSNRKYCNKATWMEDANGRRTNFTYHSASGQIATVTLPPDEEGRRAQTRYTYVQKTPTHSGADLSPVWVLDKEEFCRNSSNSGSNCSGNDETVTTYQYETENLLRIGRAVTADSKTLRTCYRYDRLGRIIGETEPNANKSSCSY